MTINSRSLSLHHIPYAKTNPNNREEVHLLLYHLIDVGQMAFVIWQEVFTAQVRQRIADALGLSVDTCGRLIAFLAALHDLGKAGPAYQKKYAPDWLRHKLENAGLALDGRNKAYDPKQLAHGTVSAWALDTLLPLLGLEPRFARKIAVAVGGHHGVLPQNDELDHISDSKQWEQVRRDLFDDLVSIFDPPTNVATPLSSTDLNAFLTILAGLTSVADWIGSQNDRYFGYLQQPLATEKYALQAEAKARTALQELGWLGWRPTGETSTFSDTFAYLGIAQPRPVQEQVIALAGQQRAPFLVIIEANTGIGKTELALFLADGCLQQNGGRGLYVAMPTQATSNQMYLRVGDFLRRRYPAMPINFHLVHGQAVWLDELKQKVELQSVGDDAEARVAAESWFGPRKRTLLAPFGVGTVDQALMSVLQTKHFFVRLFGLSHKVVIFDEVHAYDTYMNTIFHLLLTWLNAIGTSVIILSATLPNSTRRALVKAYTGKELEACEGCYPALTLANAEQQRTWQLPKPPPYTVQLEWLAAAAPEATAPGATEQVRDMGEMSEPIVDYLRQQLTAGGYAAVICNTVGHAQKVVQAIERARDRGEMAIADEDLLLFHSRFPPIWRKNIEDEVRLRFGKGGSREGTAIVVATQVIEQSLDIDFDLMISDVAPVDLLIQRAGRLHRHADNDSKRHGLARKLVLIRPGQQPGGAPDLGKSIFVYDEYILLRTYSVLQNKSAITIPDDTTTLIENVYDPARTVQLPQGVDQDYLDDRRQKMNKGEDKAQAKAEAGLVLAPNSRSLPGQGTPYLKEEDPKVHATMRASTRDIDFSMDLVCLHRDEDGLYVFAEHDHKVRINLNIEPDRHQIKALQQNTLTLQNRSAGEHFIDQPTPPGWKNTAALQYIRYAIFEGDICNLPKHTLKLTRQYGLEIIKKERA